MKLTRIKKAFYKYYSIDLSHLISSHQDGYGFLIFSVRKTVLYEEIPWLLPSAA